MTNDTIAAIATPSGEGGIAIIRVSGPESIQMVSQIFSNPSKILEAPSHTIQYGFIIDPKSGQQVEEVLVSIMRAPRSFTMEDVVEINCHGGIVSVREILGLVLAEGCKLAEPGEFTKRAFLNGRIDLTQAEAVIDLIRSKSERAFSIAMKQSKGDLSKKIVALRQIMLETLAHVEVNIDYPEHDVEMLTSEYIQSQCEQTLAEIDRLLRTAEQGKWLREGIQTVIVGKPNVGKSSLLNVLAQENRAIVTDIPGTTRDVIEEYVTIRGVPLNLMDTAGIRETIDEVEKIGVEKSRAALLEAELVILVLNNHTPLDDDERKLIAQLQNKQTIVIINKVDLPNKLELSEVNNAFDDALIIPMSIKEQEGLEKFEQALESLFFTGKIETDDLTYVSNVRHIHLLQEARSAIEEARVAAKEFIPIDMVQIDLQRGWELLGEIIGDSVGESLVDQIFSQFCLGK